MLTKRTKRAVWILIAVATLIAGGIAATPTTPATQPPENAFANTGIGAVGVEAVRCTLLTDGVWGFTLGHFFATVGQGDFGSAVFAGHGDVRPSPTGGCFFRGAGVLTVM